MLDGYTRPTELELYREQSMRQNEQKILMEIMIQTVQSRIYTYMTYYLLCIILCKNFSSEFRTRKIICSFHKVCSLFSDHRIYVIWPVCFLSPISSEIHSETDAYCILRLNIYALSLHPCS